MKPSRRPTLDARLSPIAVGCAILAMSASALAQQQAQTLETVQVTGIRASIESAINTKRDAVGVVEAIAPEDLGKLPGEG